MLGFKKFPQKLSNIWMLILISLAPAWYNYNIKINTPLCKSSPWWILRGTFLLDPCIFGLDQWQMKWQVCFLFYFSVVTSSSSQSDFIYLLVECIFCLFWFMWTKAVVDVIFKCLFIVSSIRPGKVTGWPLFITLIRADFLGLNIALCK